MNYIDPRKIKGDISKIAIALSTLVQAGLLKHYYKVVFSDGSLSEGIFLSPLDVPSCMRDNDGHLVATAALNIVPVFYL